MKNKVLANIILITIVFPITFIFAFNYLATPYGVSIEWTVLNYLAVLGLTRATQGI